MQPEYAFKIKLSQVMNTGFASIDAEEEIRAAAWKMMTLGFGELIVMQGAYRDHIREGVGP